MTGSTSKSRGVDLNFDPTRANMTDLGKFFALQLKSLSFFFIFLKMYHKEYIHTTPIYLIEGN